MIHETDDCSLLGSCFVVGLKSLLTWNSFDLLKSSSDYVFRAVSLDEEFNHLLRFSFRSLCRQNTGGEVSETVKTGCCFSCWACVKNASPLYAVKQPVENIPFICTNTTVTGPKSQMKITKQFNCLTYIVPAIHSTRCAQFYIGESGGTLDTRFKQNLADIKHRRDKPVANRFSQTDHTIHNIRVKGQWLLFTGSLNDTEIYGITLD